MKEALDYKTYTAELQEKGYRCTYYGDAANQNGLAYFETDSQVLKIEYEWLKLGVNNYTAGAVISVEDVTTCYR